MSRLLYALVSPFATFGPIIIVQSIPDRSLWDQIFASVGAVMLGLAVVAILLHQREIDARLDALDNGGRPASESSSSATVQKAV